jgi:hypothetical protein
MEGSVVVSVEVQDNDPSAKATGRRENGQTFDLSNIAPSRKEEPEFHVFAGTLLVRRQATIKRPGQEGTNGTSPPRTWCVGAVRSSAGDGANCAAMPEAG